MLTAALSAITRLMFYLSHTEITSHGCNPVRVSRRGKRVFPG